MAINISDDLFKIIKSMTIAEAGNFPKYINRYKLRYAREYIEVFRAIRKQQVYDEQLVKKSVTNSDLKENFSYHKNVICEYVMDSLVSYNGLNSIDYRLHRLLETAYIISSKLLYDRAFKILDKARKLANDYEKYYILLQILDTERKLLKQTSAVNFEKLLNENQKNKIDTWKKIENEDHLSTINDRVFSLYRELNLVKTSPKNAELKKIMQYPILQDETNALTFDSRLKFNNIYSFFYHLTGDFKLALKHREKMITIWESKPQMISEMPIRFRSDLSNLLTMKNRNRIYDDFENIIQRIESVQGGNTEENAEIFREVSYLRQVYLLNNKRTIEALALIPEIEKGLELYKASISPTRIFSFYYNIAITYFINGKFCEALPWIERIISTNRNLNVRNDLRDFCGILEIFIYFETGKKDLVESRIHSIRNRLNKQGKLDDFEKSILHYMNRLIIVDSLAEKKKQCLNEFHEKLVELFNQPGMDKQLGLEEIIMWAKDKCESFSKF